MNSNLQTSPKKSLYSNVRITITQRRKLRPQGHPGNPRTRDPPRDLPRSPSQVPVGGQLAQQLALAHVHLPCKWNEAMRRQIKLKKSQRAFRMFERQSSFHCSLRERRKIHHEKKQLIGSEVVATMERTVSTESPFMRCSRPVSCQCMASMDFCSIEYLSIY